MHDRRLQFDESERDSGTLEGSTSHRPGTDSSGASRRQLTAALVGAAGGAILSGSRPALAQPAQALGRLDSARSAGISPSQSAAENSAAYANWASDPTKTSHTLIFDHPTPYRFNAETLAVPFHRTLSGVGGATLICETEGQWFVGPGGSPFNVENLTLDGNSKVDYVLQSLGDPAGGQGSAGPTTYLSSVFAIGARVACIRGLNAYFGMRDCRTRGGPIGLLMEACSESWADGIRGDAHTDCFIRIRGSHGFEPVPNGGRMSLLRVVAGRPGDYGLDLVGVAQCDVHGITIEGALQSAIRIRDRSSNIRVFGSRSNAGDAEVGHAVVFDGCNNAYVWGGCNQGQKVLYLNEARSCRAFLAAESIVTPVDIIQEWGGAEPWQGHVRPDGTLISLSNNPPTAGAWQVHDIVWNNKLEPEEPAGWRYDGSSWVAFPPTVVEPKVGTNSGVQNVSGVDVLLLQSPLHTITEGHNGKKLIVVCDVPTARLSEDGGVGNIQLDGQGAPGMGFWNMTCGDTCTLVRLSSGEDGSHYWRETSRSTAQCNSET